MAQAFIELRQQFESLEREVQLIKQKLQMTGMHVDVQPESGTTASTAHHSTLHPPQGATRIWVFGGASTDPDSCPAMLMSCKDVTARLLPRRPALLCALVHAAVCQLTLPLAAVHLGLMGQQCVQAMMGSAGCQIARSFMSRSECCWP